jgi:hypothetical protein
MNISNFFPYHFSQLHRPIERQTRLLKLIKHTDTVFANIVFSMENIDTFGKSY